MDSVAACWEIGVANATADGFKDSTSAAFASCQMSLTNPSGMSIAGAAQAVSMISPQWDLIASCFTKYRLTKVKFHYYPQSSTASTSRMVFAYASDPNHPNIYGATTQAQLEIVEDSIPFAPWSTWSMDVSSKINRDWRFTYDALASAVQTSASSYIERFASFGAIGCISSTTVLATYGLLYLELGIEFCEFCPITTTRPALLDALHSRITVEKEKRPVSKDDQGVCETSGQDRRRSRVGSSSTHYVETTTLGEEEEEDDEMEGFIMRKLARKEAKLRKELADRWSAMFKDVGKGKERMGRILPQEVIPEEDPSSSYSEPQSESIGGSDRREKPVFDGLRPGIVTPGSPTVDSLSDSELGRLFMQRRLAAKAEGSPGSPPKPLL